MSRSRLTKSDLLSYLQCPRKLWLEHHQEKFVSEPDSTSKRRLLDGAAVGQKARDLLGKTLWPRRLDDLADTGRAALRELAAAPTFAGVEVPMVCDQLYARADALIPAPRGYVLQETKASSFPLKSDKLTPGEPDKHLLDDAAIQVWAMQQAGIPMQRVELNLLDNQWRYPGNNDYRGLFRPLDVTAPAAELQPQVPLWIEQANQALAGAEPNATTGKQCNAPHACSFIDRCKSLEPPEPEHPIELLPNSAGKQLARKLRQTKGYRSLLEPTASELTGTAAALYQRMQQAHRSGEAILAPGSEVILNALPYPRYYFDFEGIDLAVPRWVGVRPFEQIPFQWSCHIEHAPQVFTHAGFLDLSGDDPSLPCIDAMQRTLGNSGPIFVYHAVYERGRLQELAERHPQHAQLLQSLIGRLVDLLPIVRDHFYHPAMQGSFSIKKVLPVIAPELDYAALDEVQEGTGAQLAYIEAALAPGVNSERKADIERKLKIYCEQDTWAMVEVAYFLSHAKRPERLA